MNLRLLAKRDAALTIEGEQAGNTLCTLTDGGGRSWEVKMILYDVGFQTDTEGNAIAGRTCYATYVSDRVADNDGNILTPRRGWRLSWTDIHGKAQRMFVSFAEPDTTVGFMRIFLVVQLGAET